MGVIIAVNIAIIKQANYFLHWSCIISNGSILVLTAALSSFPVFTFFYHLYLSVYLSLFYVSLNSLTLWQGFEKGRAGENPTDSVGCVNYYKINFEIMNCRTNSAGFLCMDIIVC